MKEMMKEMMEMMTIMIDYSDDDIFLPNARRKITYFL